mmetsp:Transcript_18860/g.60129  ORF Transcript_18860/g.60129 Transcript_18860/m.60129 type:complete len:217 (+) Transcript_18860:190-840(+)
MPQRARDCRARSWSCGGGARPDCDQQRRRRAPQRRRFRCRRVDPWNVHEGGAAASESERACARSPASPPRAAPHDRRPGGAVPQSRLPPRRAGRRGCCGAVWSSGGVRRRRADAGARMQVAARALRGKRRQQAPVRRGWGRRSAGWRHHQVPGLVWRSVQRRVEHHECDRASGSVCRCRWRGRGHSRSARHGHPPRAVATSGLRLFCPHEPRIRQR